MQAAVHVVPLLTLRGIVGEQREEIHVLKQPMDLRLHRSIQKLTASGMPCPTLSIAAPVIVLGVR
jgi:hypothetical protein